MDRLRADWVELRGRLRYEVADCRDRQCDVHRDDWEVLATTERLLGVARTEPGVRRNWWEE